MDHLVVPSLHNPEWRRQCDALRALVFGRSPLERISSESPLFRYTDREQLRRFRARFIGDLRTRRRRGSLSFERMYEGTLSGVSEVERVRLLRDFCESTWFAGYGETSERGRPRCFEEAMYRFLDEEGVGQAELRRVEFLDAMMRALVVQPACAFSLPPEIRATDFGFLALSPMREQTMLFAIVENRFVRGPISDPWAVFLRSAGVRDAASTPEDWEHIRSELAGIGIEFF